MHWAMTADAGEFLAAAGEFLRSRPVEHTVQLTVADRLRDNGPGAFGDAPPLLGWWTDGAEVAGAFVLTPPHPVSVTGLPEPAVVALADALAAAVPDLAGIDAEVGRAELFARRWREIAGAGARQHRRLRLYRLDRLIPVRPGPPGRARLAGPDDRELLIAWHDAFARDTGERAINSAVRVGDRLGYGGIRLWEVDEVPVAMAARSRTVCGMARVAPVYTPAGRRRHGYGSAATEAVTRDAQEAGAHHVVLFTDLANPTSNAIYQRLGYRPVEDRIVLSFAPEEPWVQ